MPKAKTKSPKQINRTLLVQYKKFVNAIHDAIAEHQKAGRNDSAAFHQALNLFPVICKHLTPLESIKSLRRKAS